MTKYNADYHHEYYLKNQDKKINYSRKYRFENRDKRLKYYLETKEKYDDMRLQKNFGISLEEYKEILKEQNGVCAICGKKDTDRSLAVDHCHLTGVVRGLLCKRCNLALGYFNDKVELLDSAKEYLNGQIHKDDST